MQRFEPYAKRQHFRLLGDPETTVDGVIIRDTLTAREVCEKIRRGVAEHSEVAALWDAWHK